MNRTQIFPKKPIAWPRIALGVGGWSLLLGSWVLLWVGLPAVIPAGPASWLSWRESIPAGFILINLGLLAHRLRGAGSDRGWIPWMFGVTNTLFYLLSLTLNRLSQLSASLSQLQFPVEDYYTASMIVLVCLLAFNLFIFQSRVNMPLPELALTRWRSVGLLLGAETLLIGSILWFPVTWTGLIWVDRLFYPYTPVLITGLSLVILLLIMLGTLVINQPALAGEGTPSLEKSE
jgi:hypothetical protein